MSLWERRGFDGIIRRGRVSPAAELFFLIWRNFWTARKENAIDAAGSALRWISAKRKYLA